MAEERELVRFEKDGDVGVITVDNPPVNALSPGVPEGIVAALNKGIGKSASRAKSSSNDATSVSARITRAAISSPPVTRTPTARPWRTTTRST